MTQVLIHFYVSLNSFLMKILIIRLSAMGDVALIVPVVEAFSKRYDDVEIFMLTNKLFNPFFSEINNLTLINPKLKGKHKGFLGLFKLYKEIKKEYSIDVVIDLHDVLRSKFLRFLFTFSGIKTFKIEKGRDKKKKLVKQKEKVLKQLKHSAERYKDVFEDADFYFSLDKKNIQKKKQLPDEFRFKSLESVAKIGIAPFAMHKQKQYTYSKMLQVIEQLNERGYEMFIFGGGNSEKEKAFKIENKFKNVSSLIGKYKLQDEMKIISNLDLMITMDSSNMHIAALMGVNIISIWGATHPYAGFTPFISDEKSFIIQNEDLTCRPCSVYGNKECYKGTLECFETIQVDEIIKTCEGILKSK